MVTMATVASCGDDDKNEKSEFEIAGSFSKGSGTKADPYVISTAGELAYLAKSTNDGSSKGYAGEFFELSADIDLDGIDWEPIGNYDPDEEGQPNMAKVFQGFFDGKGHTVSNLKYESSSLYVGTGLFGVVMGQLSNINCNNFNVSVTLAEAQAIGALVGYCSGAIDNCHITKANVKGNSCVGGMVGGSNICTITNCSAKDITVTLIGDNDFSKDLVQANIAQCGGLLVGGAFGGNVSNCQSSGTVSANGNEPVAMGGISGCLSVIDHVSDCTTDVKIVSTKGGHAIGGICGFAGTITNTAKLMEKEGFTCETYPAEFTNCTAKIDIETPNATHVGGIVGTGLLYLGEESAFKLTNCNVNGTITATTPGTIVGRGTSATIIACTADVKINGEKSDTEIGTTTTAYKSAEQ